MFRQYMTYDYWRQLLIVFLRLLQTKRFWKEFVMMTVGMLFGAAAVYYFLMPSSLIVGTISGLCMVLNEMVGGTTESFSNWMLIVNALLLIVAFVLVGEEFGAKTVYTGLILGPFTVLLEKIYPYTNFTHTVVDMPDVMAQLQAGMTVLDVHGNPYLLSQSGEVLMRVKDSVLAAGLGTGDIWFDAIAFVFLLSACQAFEFRIGASTGGLDIVAKILSKYLHMDIGTAVTLSGAFVCVTAFSIHDFRMVVIGLITTWINGLVVDYFTATFNKRKRVCIISPDHEQIRSYIIHDLVRGCSIYKVQGGYSGEEQTEIQALLTQDEFGRLMNYMQSHHIHAFTTAGNCSEVYGLWLKHKKKHGHVEIDND